jgi:protein-L-isoaspartate(D-aspartate) O-methyltransferase
MLTKQVYAVERIAPLLARCRENLRQLGLSQVRLKHADGMNGMPEAAPFDTIVVAAASAGVPQALREQLAPGGRLLMPVGALDQVLHLVERGPQGFVETRFDPVRFVPLLPGVE